MAEGWIDHERTFSGQRAGGPGSRTAVFDSSPREDSGRVSAFSVIRIIEEAIPEGRSPYVRARQALAEIALAKDKGDAESVIMHLAEAAEADENGQFAPPLSEALSSALHIAHRAFGDATSWRWHRRASSYPYGADECGDVTEQYEAVHMLLAAIVDHGSAVPERTEGEQ